jgi:hypothetical protein
MFRRIFSNSNKITLAGNPALHGFVPGPFFTAHLREASGGDQSKGGQEVAVQLYCSVVLPLMFASTSIQNSSEGGDSEERKQSTAGIQMACFDARDIEALTEGVLSVFASTDVPGSQSIATARRGVHDDRLGMRVFCAPVPDSAEGQRLSGLYSLRDSDKAIDVVDMANTLDKAGVVLINKIGTMLIISIH